ncbi:MAG: metallophosphoesterase [Methanomicrobia archaeon]|nr:metallophosphoesterase [Methanomicrobia archaeon]
MIKMGGIIVVADTHFGIKKDSISMPGYFADFLKWFKKLEEENENVKFLDKNNITEKTLKNPEKIILLGDIIELWDSDDEAVSACVSTLIPTLAEIEAEKIYVLGNHDNILEKALLPQEKEYYPLGKSNLKLVEDVYPSDKFLTVGDQNYVFVHGYQFDKYFTNTGKLYKILPALRNLSNSLTDYVPFLFFISLIFKFINFIGNKSIFLGKDQLLYLLFVLTIPKLYMTLGRWLWIRFSGVRYKKQETIDNFTKWWKKFIKNKEIPENLNVVYGHTHFLNYIPAKKIDNETYDFYIQKLKKRDIPQEKRPTLVNISAWIKDIKKKEKDEKYKNVMVASFLYIDEQGFEFFGWDWYEHKIFHIPKMAINERREKGLVDENTARVLKDLGWPEKLIKKWQKSVEI